MLFSTLSLYAPSIQIGLDILFPSLPLGLGGFHKSTNSSRANHSPNDEFCSPLMMALCQEADDLMVQVDVVERLLAEEDVDVDRLEQIKDKVCGSFEKFTGEGKTGRLL